MLNLGQVNFGLGVDTRSLDAAVNRVRAFGNAVETNARGIATNAAGIETAFKRQEAAVLRGLNQVLKMNDAIRRTTQGAEQVALLDRTRNAFVQLESQLARGQRTTDRKSVV